VHDDLSAGHLDLTRSTYAHRSRLCWQYGINTTEHSKKRTKGVISIARGNFDLDFSILNSHRCRAVAAADLVSVHSSEVRTSSLLDQTHSFSVVSVKNTL
jgi:hypothetical protein